MQRFMMPPRSSAIGYGSLRRFAHASRAREALGKMLRQPPTVRCVCGTAAGALTFVAISPTDPYSLLAEIFLLLSAPGLIVLIRRQHAGPAAFETALALFVGWICFSVNLPIVVHDGEYYIDEAVPNLIFGVNAGWALACLLVRANRTEWRDYRSWKCRFSLRRLFIAIFFICVAISALRMLTSSGPFLDTLWRQMTVGVTCVVACGTSIGVLLGRTRQCIALGLILTSPVLSAFLMTYMALLLVGWSK